MKNLFSKFLNSSTVERAKSRLGLSFKTQKELPNNFTIGMAILAYERPEYLEICLNSLFKTNLHDYDITFFIIDDGSKDKRVKEIINKPRDKKYKIIRIFKEKGPNSAGAAINRAMREVLEHSNFDLVGWSDPDALYHPDWLKYTMDIFLWAKKYHRDHVLGPITSFNSSDFVYHQVLGSYESPYGKYIVKRQAGMLNYFYFRSDFEKFGSFIENLEDETDMTNRFESLKIRNFCPDVSYIEHIGQESVLNKWRPVKYKRAMFALHPVENGWFIDFKKFRKFEKEYYEKITKGYEYKLLELERIKKTPLLRKLIQSILKN